MDQSFSYKQFPPEKPQATPEVPEAPAQGSNAPTFSNFKDKRHKDPFSTLTFEKKYFEFDEAPQPYPIFIKRNLTPEEYIRLSDGSPLVPYMTLERVKNEVASIQFIKEHTTIPVPNIRCAFEDNGRYFILTDIVPGVVMADLEEEQKPTVIAELRGYIDQMHSLRSKALGGVLGDVCIPYRLIKHVKPSVFHNLPEAETPDYVFCHNDLSQYNIIVNQETLKINAILDWEYAGFYPAYFDSPFYLRKGPSGAIGDEVDDTLKLLEFLNGFEAAI